MILNTELIRRRRIELRLSQRAVATHLGVSGGVVRGLETGFNHTDITVGLLTKLADILAVNIATLFQHHDTDTGADGTARDDVATLGAALHTSDTLTPVTALAEALGWTADRVNTAAGQLAGALEQCGLRLHRLNGQLAIERSSEALDTDRIRSVTRAHLLRAGISITEARLLKRIADGRPLRDLSNADAVAVGVLTNARLITTTPPSATMTLDDDVSFSVFAEMRRHVRHERQ